MWPGGLYSASWAKEIHGKLERQVGLLPGGPGGLERQVCQVASPGGRQVVSKWPDWFGSMWFVTFVL